MEDSSPFKCSVDLKYCSTPFAYDKESIATFSFEALHSVLSDFPLFISHWLHSQFLPNPPFSPALPSTPAFGKIPRRVRRTWCHQPLLPRITVFA